MTSRRPLLTALVLAIAATAPTRVRASTEGEVDGVAGTSPGGWACGPIGRVNYAGGGARVKVAQTAAPLGGKGWNGELAGAAARESTRLVSCDRDCQETDHVMPPDTTMFAGHARAGYQWDVVGVTLGGTLFEDYEHNTDRKPSVRFVPDGELAFRRHDSARFVAGIGSPTVTTLLRPTIYAGGDFMVGTVELGGIAGIFRAGASTDHAWGCELAAKLPLGDAFKLRLGGGANLNDGRYVGGQGSVGGIVTF